MVAEHTDVARGLAAIAAITVGLVGFVLRWHYAAASRLDQADKDEQDVETSVDADAKIQPEDQRSLDAH